jgi:hypothetical protein
VTRSRTALLALGALAALCAAQYARVSWENFGGADEWLILELNSRGIVSMPHSNRPLNLIWSLPAVLVTPHRFEGYRLVYLGYLTLSGWLTWLLARRLLPAAPLFALSAAAFALGWAPSDMARLAVVQMVPNAGVTFASLLAMVLLAEFWRTGRRLFFAAAVVVACVTARSYEGALGLLLGAPLLLLLLPQPQCARGPKRPLLWIAAWEAVVAILTLAAALPFLAGHASSLYQSSVVKPDLDAGRYLGRLASQYAFQLGPLLPSDRSELALAGIAPAVLVFLVSAWILGRGPAAPASRGRLLALAGLGLALAGLGHSVLALGASVLGPTRMQFLSGPGIAIFLAAAIALLASWAPAPARPACAVALAAAVVGVGTGHTVGMQRQWDRITRYPAQRACLVALVREANGLRPGTLLLLVDEDGTWPFAMTFRHAARLVYGADMTAHVVESEQLLYGISSTGSTLRVTPWPVVQAPWREGVTEHGFDQVIVFVLSGGRVSRLDEWRHASLPLLPAGARYAPLLTITNGPAAPGRRVLD